MNSPSSLRNQITAAATKVFFEKGYAGSSVRDISLSAKVSESSIFRLFVNKQNILREVWEDAATFVVSRYREKLSMLELNEHTSSPKALLSAFAENVFDLCESTEELPRMRVGVLYAEAGTPAALLSDEHHIGVISNFGCQDIAVVNSIFGRGCSSSALASSAECVFTGALEHYVFSFLLKSAEDAEYGTHDREGVRQVLDAFLNAILISDSLATSDLEKQGITRESLWKLREAMQQGVVAIDKALD